MRGVGRRRERGQARAEEPQRAVERTSDRATFRGQALPEGCAHQRHHRARALAQAKAKARATDKGTGAGTAKAKVKAMQRTAQQAGGRRAKGVDVRHADRTGRQARGGLEIKGKT